MQSPGQFYFFTIGICLAAMSKNRMTKYNVVIETPRNSREKYTYDEESKGFFLKKLLPAGMCFPYDFGFIPVQRVKMEILLMRSSFPSSEHFPVAGSSAGSLALYWRNRQKTKSNDTQ
jgi:hypothetical protein